MLDWRSKWLEFRAAVTWALSRFPVAILALAAFGLYVNLDIAGAIHVADDEIVRAGVALVGAAAIATAVVLLGERIGTPPPVRHVLSLAVAALLGAALYWWERLGVTVWSLFLGVALTIPLAPYLRRDLSGCWAFVWRLAHAFALGFIAVIVFCAGLSAILATIDYLFGVDMGSDPYEHVWSIGLGFVGPLFALSLIPTAFPEHDAPDADNIIVAGIRLLSDFVAVPLLAAYVVILHVYALKILIESELPRGQIGWMVLSFGLAVLALRVVVHAMADLARAPTRLFLRYWWPGLIVPLVLLVIAVLERIIAYGVTPERYGLVLYAVFLGSVLLAQLLPTLRGDIRVIPAFGTIALVAASFGPWSVNNVSARSQADRVVATLEGVGALEDGTLAATPELSRERAQELRSMLDVLLRIRQTERLHTLFVGHADDPFASPDFRFAGLREQSDRLRTALNIKVLPAAPGGVGGFHFTARPGPVSLDSYDVAIVGLNLAEPRRTEATVGDAALHVGMDGITIVIGSGLEEFRISPAMLRDAFSKQSETVGGRSVERPPVLVELDYDGRRIGIVFTEASGTLTEDNLDLTGGRFDLLVRRADWADSSGGAPRDGSEP